MFDLMLDLKNAKWILIHKILLDDKVLWIGNQRPFSIRQDEISQSIAGSNLRSLVYIKGKHFFAVKINFKYMFLYLLVFLFKEI